MNRLRRFFILASFAFVLSLHSQAYAQKLLIPQSQDKPPGPALTPEEAIAKMVVPDGFHVELLASEPDIVNPVAMAIDERGRFWITESVEYPRHPAGKGKDRVKILEDTDGEGKIDKVTVFADGLNIPSGIAVGYGGVWVSNSPDILYYPLAADGVTAGEPQVVVTGFGRADTHEMPNTLTWGPDGWLYGLNGVFNPSVVKSNNGKTYRFTCAVPNQSAHTRIPDCVRRHQQPLGPGVGYRRERVRQRLRDRSSLAPDRNRLLPSPGWVVSAVHLGVGFDRQPSSSEGRLLWAALLR